MRWKILILSLCALIAVVVVDYATGYEFMVHTFYSIPVSIAAWWIGRRAAVAMSVASGLAWWFADAASGHHYSHPIYGAWNAFICFLSFAAGGILLAQLRLSFTESQRKSAELKAALDDLQRSAARVRELEAKLRMARTQAALVQKEDL
jgi:K+-sensing histidine kinase KdpD